MLLFMRNRFSRVVVALDTAQPAEVVAVLCAASGIVRVGLEVEIGTSSSTSLTMPVTYRAAHDRTTRTLTRV